jgi:outer membrane biosynthesis protein TonB
MWNRKHPIAPGFDWRLKVALDRIKPPSVMPRYAMARRAIRPWRVAPIALAGAATVLLALSATAATGSANPVVWSQRAASTIEAVGHAPETSPSPAPSPEGSPTTVRSAPVAAPKHATAPKTAPKPSPTKRPEETPRPTPSDEHSGSSSPSPSPRPSPSPDEN